MRYETLVVDPEPTLRKACGEMGLEWDAGMLSWPKQKDQFAAPRHGSPTFRQSLGGSFAETVKPSLADLRVGNVPAEDLEWLEREFEEFNRTSGYVEHAPAPSTGPREARETRAVPKWENTRRYRKTQRPFTKFQTAVSRIASNMKGAVSGKKPGDASGERE